MTPLRRTLAVALVALVGVAFAQFPERDITYVISFNAGGESDITARLQQPHLEDILGVNVSIVNRPGGGGAVAWSESQRSTDPDGYTIIGVNLPHIATQPMERTDTGFETDNFEIITWFQFTPNALLVRNDSPFQTLDELIAYAKENPGSVTLGGSGSNTANHIAVLQLEQFADIDLTYVPFTGTGPTVPALLGGHVTGLMSYSPMAVLQQDQVRTLAIASAERVSFLPDAPTFVEQGIDIVSGAHRGVAAPPGTPEDVVATLADAFEEASRRISTEQEEMGFVMLNVRGDEADALIDQVSEEYAAILETLQ
ncbi:MAG: tripartite tricarboxylate transporter substrate binding protein [Trueperaceae bacterium]|nr:tripartite tricarboxylate transporter substrate binding protein [Trueperaceae bacterium]